MITLDKRQKSYLLVGAFGVLILVLCFTVDLPVSYEYRMKISSTTDIDYDDGHLIIGMHNNGGRDINRVTVLVKIFDTQSGNLREKREITFHVGLRAYESAKTKIYGINLLYDGWSCHLKEAYGPLL